jgi:hypothetical protein
VDGSQKNRGSSYTIGPAPSHTFLHPFGTDYNFHSIFYRSITVLVLIPLTLLIGFLIIKRVPANIVGPLLILWSGSVAFRSIREEIGPAVFALYYAYDLVFDWTALFLMFLHFPDGKIYAPGAARWIYRLLGMNVIMNTLIFISTNPFRFHRRQPTHSTPCPWEGGRVMNPGSGLFTMFFYAINGLFPPVAIGIAVLRYRIQTNIDRRFFRKKYDSDQVLARFAATARSEVTLEPLIAVLLSNVEETLQPEQMSLWLKAPPAKKSSS